MFIIRKFFDLKAMESNGVIRKATFKERIKWLFTGCKCGDRKVMERYSRMLQNHLHPKGKSQNFDF